MPSYPLAFPPVAAASERLQLNNQQVAMQSPHTLAQQTINTASQWTLEIELPRMSLSRAMVVQAWLDSLNGQVGSFRYQPRSHIRNPLMGRTLAQDAHSYGTSVRLAGWAAGAESGLSMGQLYSFGDQLFRITAVAFYADAQGRVLVEHQPQLRQDFPAGTAINFATPSGVFRLVSSETPSFKLDVDRLPSFPAIAAKEAF